MLRLSLIGLAFATLTFGPTACSSDSSKTKQVATKPTPASDGPDHGAAHGAAHIYQCPMHPEVVSDKPGDCPKCGMHLEHTDNVAGSGRTFEMRLTKTPEAVEAGKPVKLAFRPVDKAAPDAPVPLALVHEKKIHLIIVSRDLSEFFHEHPTFGADGAYTQEFTFKTGGDYVLFQDYTPDGDRHQLGRQDVTVNGAKRPAVKFDKDVMTWKDADGYAAELTFDQPAKVGASLAVQTRITRNGQPVTDLDNYLGALGHMVIISEDTKQYLHVHPQDQTDKGPAVGFHTQFEQAGRYRVFLQFNHGDKIHTADFVVNVAPAGAAS
jgi:Heavy metal binding domain